MATAHLSILGGVQLIAGGAARLDGASWSTEREPSYASVDHVLFDLLDNGCEVEVDGAWHRLKAGTITFVPAHHRHRRRLAGTCRNHWLAFRLDALSLDLQLAADGRPVAWPATTHRPWAEALAAVPALLEGRARAHERWLVEGLLLQLAARLLPGAGATVPADPRLAAALRYLDQHHRDRPSLAVIAARAGCPPRTLHHLFRAAVGCSPVAYAHRRRMREAHHLLTTTTLPVTAIAARCGYDDPLHLSRLVRREFGLGPRALRARRGWA